MGAGWTECDCGFDFWFCAYFRGNREWAEREDYVPPIRFVDMQRKGRERVDGTVIVGGFITFLFFLLFLTVIFRVCVWGGLVCISFVSL